MIEIETRKELERLAQLVKTELSLDFDVKSVEFVEGFIERNRGAFVKGESSGLVNSIAAFLGKCIIENYGGDWDMDADSNAICVAFDAGNKIFPFAKVAKQFENGTEDSVHSFFELIPLVFKLESLNLTGKDVIDQSSARVAVAKKWWKF